MSYFFDCPHLSSQVELSDERESHIIQNRHWIITAYTARKLAGSTS